MLAVTHEAKGDTERFVERTGADFAYAYDKGGKLARWFGVGGIPDAVLIDPYGTVVWRGHPGKVKGKLIETHLGGALRQPLWEWPSSARSVRTALIKRQYARALAHAEKTGGGEGHLAQTLREMISGQVARLEAARARGDFLTARDLSASLTKQLSGLPEADVAKGIADAIKSDKAAQKVIKAQKDIAKIRAEVGELKKKKDADKLVAKLEKRMAKHPGTYAYEEARQLVEDIRRKRGKLR